MNKRMKKIIETMVGMLVVLAFCALVFFAIRNSIIAYDPEETAREKMQAVARKRADIAWEGRNRYGAEEYRQWKEDEDEYWYLQKKNKRFRKRYEREKEIENE